MSELTSTRLKFPEACQASLITDKHIKTVIHAILAYLTKTGPADPSSYPGCFIIFLISSFRADPKKVSQDSSLLIGSLSYLGSLLLSLKPCLLLLSGVRRGKLRIKM